jgi:8-oxo-dGTP diphosphatase
MPADFMEPRAWHASLAGVIAVAAALITDPGGNVLLVKQNYRDAWALPGGICEFGEPPHEGCRREVTEELGLDRPAGPLLAVDWYPAGEQYGPTARPALYFVFDGGSLGPEPRIALQREELDEYQFVRPAGLERLLAPPVLRRVSGALAALRSGGTTYVPQWLPDQRPAG